MILSTATNPYYFAGTTKEFYGVGSQHTNYGHIWPMALIMRALTSTDVGEIVKLLDMVKKSASYQHLLYESFDVNNPSDATRPWFAWCNSLFGEAIMRLVKRYPSLFVKSSSSSSLHNKKLP
jgi:meiotically up-regulated gene 157 (Mug157) protein